MPETVAQFTLAPGSETSPARNVARIPVGPLGMALGLFLAITFVLCVLFDLWFPTQAMNPA